jgi:hypothetical protein
MPDNAGFDFGELSPALVGAGQLTAASAGASPVVASGAVAPTQAPPSSLNGSVFVGGGQFLTSHDAVVGGGAFNPSNNLDNPAGH